MARDPHNQREDERAREDEDYRKRTHAERLERLREQAGAAIGFDPTDGGRMLTAPVREYACDDHPEPHVHVVPKAVKNQAGNVTGYHYPVADGPYCVRCGRLMTRLWRDPAVES